MKEIVTFPSLTANRRRLPIFMGLVPFILVSLAISGCTVRRTIKTKVPPKILLAKTASMDELLNLIQKYDKITSLSTRLEVTYSSGQKDSGVIRQIRKQPGYVAFKRPDTVHLVVQNFVSKFAELEMLSVGDDLSIWVRRENKLYLGKNSAKELVAEDVGDARGFSIPIRGGHVFEAIFPQSVNMDAPDTRNSIEEESDSEAKYYVLGFYREGKGQRIHTTRRIWIERSSLTIARQQVYLDDGRILSDIAYTSIVPVGGFNLPLKMHIDRPLDEYALDLEFKSWQINPDLADNAFVMTPHEGAQVIHLAEKAF